MQAVCAKLLAHGWGHLRQATAYQMGLDAPSYWLTDEAIFAKLLLADGAICAKLLANGSGHMRQATG